MRYISEKAFNREMKKITQDNLSKERARKLKEARRMGRPKRRLPPTSKIVLFCVIFLCVEIVVFCEWAMVRLYDISSIYVLIGIPAALAPVIWGYYSKAKAENTANGVGITFQSMMNEYSANNEMPADDPSEEDDCTGVG